MLTSHFDYHLPQELIAQFPLAQRSSSRLLCLNRQTGAIEHSHFRNFLDLITDKDLLVFNDTRVLAARLYARKMSGGKIEILVERILNATSVLAHVKSNKSLKLPLTILLENEITAEIVKKEHDLFEIRFQTQLQVTEMLKKIGHIPLPKYIQRTANREDLERYQTVYGVKEGAVAAPTAGLHFDHEIMSQIKERQINTANITLHVGAGTFKPVQVNEIRQHKMHSEYIEVSKEVCELITKTREKGGRIVAIGTTTLRALETATNSQGICLPFYGETDIFIYPGYQFRCVDALLTNFHLPKSTLLMLVCALAGYEHVLNAYHEAIQSQYRFYSYGDAMWIS